MESAVANFTAEEQQLMDSLREKYSNFKGGVPVVSVTVHRAVI